MANVTKVLGGVEDLMFGTGSATQSRAGSNYAINKIDKPHPVSTKAALKLLPVNNVNIYYRTVVLLGNTVAGDNGAGLFYHDPNYAQASADDFDIIVDSTAGPNGCWRRIIPSVKKEFRATVTSVALASGGLSHHLVTHGLGTDDIEFGGQIFGSSGIDLGGYAVSAMLLGLDGRYDMIGRSAGGAAALTLPGSGELRVSIYNGDGLAQDVTVHCWIRART